MRCWRSSGSTRVADHPAAGLPYGTLKRVELARALAGQPALLLADEPAAGLNHEEVGALGAVLKSIRDDRGVTILLVEHHMRLVMQVSDRVVVLDFGAQDRRGHRRPRSSAIPRSSAPISATSSRWVVADGRPAECAGAGGALRRHARCCTASRFEVAEGGITTILGRQRRGQDHDAARGVRHGEDRRRDHASAGKRIDGRATESIVRLGIAHVPEGRGTFVQLTVQENLRLGAYARRDPANLERRHRAGAAATSRCWPSDATRWPARCRAASSRCSRWRGR